MDKQGIIQRLMELPGEIEQAENDLIEAQAEVQNAKDDLTNLEGELLLSGAIDGKNAEQRAVQMRQLTIIERQNLAEAEQSLAGSRAHLNKLQNTFKALRSVVRLISGEVA